MTLSKWKCVIAASLLADCIFISLPAISQGKPTQSVLVVNTPAQPVPTAAQGTTNVTGTVNIGNTPNVNVANTPTVSLAAGSSVNVSNPLDAQNNPIPLATLDAIQPYEDQCPIAFLGNSRGSCLFQPVPAGKRLVIQEFDALGTVEFGLKPTEVFVIPNSGISHYFPATPMSDAHYFATHQETRLYVGPGQTPSCGVFLSDTSFGNYYCQFSGFLVDAP
jgi:hypothetical protein